MSIYNNPEQYAKETHMTLAQAEVRCAHFKQLAQKMEDIRTCPKCGKNTLELEGGSYEEGIKASVYCENDEVKVVDEEDGEEYFTDCDFTSPVTKEYQALDSYYDFDIVLEFAGEINEVGITEIEKRIGSSWNDFVEKENKTDQKEQTA